MSGTTAEAAAKAPIEALRTLWGGPELAPLWTAARQRLERNGRVLGGRPVVLRDPLVATRDRVAALLGELRRPTGDVPVSLARLDAALRASRFGLGLLEVLEALDGQPVRDRRAERTAAKDTLRVARRELAAHPALHDHPGLAAWVDSLDARGLLGAAPDLPPPARLALDILAQLPADGVNRAELAHRVVGDAHALDDDAALTRLVLSGIAGLLGTGVVPVGDASARRELWEAAGVVSNPLTCHALVLNLPLAGDGRIVLRLRESAAEGMAERLLLSQLRAEPLDATPLAGRTVWVCENPVVTERAEAALGSAAGPLVCVEGWMNSAVARLLTALHNAGAELAYHGDFDWPGTRIAASVLGRFPARPWRFRAADYLAAIAARSSGLPQLEGRPSPTPWDPALAEAMTAAGLVVEEEAILAELLTDLAS
jgi:uncharacterized protein (TIGR02679 family)